MKLQVGGSEFVAELDVNNVSIVDSLCVPYDSTRLQVHNIAVSPVVHCENTTLHASSPCN